MTDYISREAAMPESCVKCEWRDAEAGGDCELMICNSFETYTEQYKHCPFQVISKRYSLIPVLSHGRLGDLDDLQQRINTLRIKAMADGVDVDPYWHCLDAILQTKTIIPAEEADGHE